MLKIIGWSFALTIMYQSLSHIFISQRMGILCVIVWMICVFFIHSIPFIKKKHEQSNLAINGKLFYLRLGFYGIMILISGFIYPICDKIDLTNTYSNYTLINDYNGEYSNFLIYFKNDSKIDGAKVFEGEIFKDEKGEYSYRAGKGKNGRYADEYSLNVSNSLTNEYAYLLKYNSLDGENKNVNLLLTPFYYIGEVLMQYGIYTMLFIFFVLIVRYIDPKLIDM